MAKESNIRICTICSSEFDIVDEGGVEGDIGILPVCFCPTCNAGILDYAEQILCSVCSQYRDEV